MQVLIYTVVGLSMEQGFNFVCDTLNVFPTPVISTHLLLALHIPFKYER
jgi:hypothetical protein